MKYLWELERLPHRFAPLEGDAKTNVLIIGGGMAGVLCALLLRQAGEPCILVEAQIIGSGITKGTTAVLSAQHDTLYTSLVQTIDRSGAKAYLESNLNALKRFRELARGILCDWETCPSIMYSTTRRDQMRNEAETVRSLGFPAEFITETPLPFSVAGAVRFPEMAQFHPLKFLDGVAKELPIFEHTFVSRLEGCTAYTKSGKITAQKVIVATHFPFINRHGLYFMKLYQKRSFVLALENAPALGCTLVDAAENGMYSRNYRNLLLIGGGDHRTGKKAGGFEAVRAFAKSAFPQAKEAFAWANQDCMSLDGLPYIGPYSPAMPNVFVCTGFNEWGMTSSMVAAQILTDLALGKNNSDARIYSPQRSMVKPQLFANIGETVMDFAIPTVKRCPHLGCALRWNAAEHSWDCPCHGSRFDQHGRLVDNPAMRDSRV